MSAPLFSVQPRFICSVTTGLFSVILLPMIDALQHKDLMQLVGAPGTPLPKLSADQRAALKRLLEQDPAETDAAMRIRAALAGRGHMRVEWLSPGTIERGLTFDDILDNIQKLSVRSEILHAAEVVEVMSKQIDRNPKAVFRALHRFLIDKEFVKKPFPTLTLDKLTALKVMKTITALVPMLLQGRLTALKKKIPRDVLEIAYHVVKSCPEPHVVLLGIDFIRVLERYIGWSQLEKNPLVETSNEILAYPGRIIPELLQRDCLAEATMLSERVKYFQICAQSFKTAVRKIVLEKTQLSIASRNWALRLLEATESNAAAGLSVAQMIGDAGHERLALLLVNIWEARNEGTNAAHAFALCEELLRNGFGIYLVGEVGSVIRFDPDVHEANPKLTAGERARLVRPSVEVRSEKEIRILIKGRVSPITL